jgi:hypothetical protein
MIERASVRAGTYLSILLNETFSGTLAAGMLMYRLLQLPDDRAGISKSGYLSKYLAKCLI